MAIQLVKCLCEPLLCLLVRLHDNCLEVHWQAVPAHAHTPPSVQEQEGVCSQNMYITWGLILWTLAEPSDESRLRRPGWSLLSASSSVDPAHKEREREVVGWGWEVLGDGIISTHKLFLELHFQFCLLMPLLGYGLWVISEVTNYKPKIGTDCSSHWTPSDPVSMKHTSSPWT